MVRFKTRFLLKAGNVLFMLLLALSTSKAAVLDINRAATWYAGTATNSAVNSGLYLFNDDVVVHKDVVLTVEPGVTVAFAASKGLLIERGGTLIARGSRERRITFKLADSSQLLPNDIHVNTRQSFFATAISSNSNQQEQQRQQFPTVRLIDNNGVDTGSATTTRGRLQFYYLDKWRSVCTLSFNWTNADFHTVCRELRFGHAAFDGWYAHRNETPAVAIVAPHCIEGIDSNLNECLKKFYERKATFPQYAAQGDESESEKQLAAEIGATICDTHADLGVACWQPLPEILQNFWSGIHFVEPKFQTLYQNHLSRIVNISDSVLEYVDIERAGGNYSLPTLSSAIEAVGVPPQIRHVNVRNSFYNGINLTHTSGVAALQHVEVTGSQRGHGIFVNTTQGNVTFHRVRVENNFGDGIRFHYNDTFPFYLEDRFCTRSNFGSSQLYPLMLAGFHRTEVDSRVRGEDCTQEFVALPSNVLTVHILYFECSSTSPIDSAYLEIHDGLDPESSPLLARVPIVNFTRPQTVSSSYNRLSIRFRARAGVSAAFMLKLTAAPLPASDYDLRVSDSQIRGNFGNGILATNIHSSLQVERTIVERSGYHGISVFNGAGDVNVTNCHIMDTALDGVNISYAGGRRNISQTTVTRSGRRALSVYINETTTSFYALQQRTDVADSVFENNVGGGILHGNFCYAPLEGTPRQYRNFKPILLKDSAPPVRNPDMPLIFNITNVTFTYTHAHAVAVELWSCLLPNATATTNLIMQFNTFRFNRHTSLEIRPAANLVAQIGNNTFSDNVYGAVWIENMRHAFHEEEWSSLPVDILIADNLFENNRGPFVVSLGLSEYSTSRQRWQRAELSRNKFIGNNILSNSGQSDYAPHRHHVPAVVAIGSSNVYVIFNSFEYSREATLQLTQYAGKDNLQSVFDPAAESSKSSFEFARIPNLAKHNKFYWVAVHLRDFTRTINVTRNWWSSLDEQIIRDSIFDHYARYDLAQAIFVPFLARPEVRYPVSFRPNMPRIAGFVQKPLSGGGMTRLGGFYAERDLELDGEYVVESDIHVLPGAILRIKQGSTLKFRPSVGMLVEGRLDATGTASRPIIFTLREKEEVDEDDDVLQTSSQQQRRFVRQTRINPQLNFDVSNNWQEGFFPGANMGLPPASNLRNSKSILSSNITAEISNSATTPVSVFFPPRTPFLALTEFKTQIRLVDGKSPLEGRLEIYIDSKWGTVCSSSRNDGNDGWTLRNAGVVCRQLGYVHHPSDFIDDRNRRFPAAAESMPIHLSNVDCNVWDTDIERCRAEREHSCTHARDVGVKCRPLGWAGLRFGLTSERSVLQHVNISRAGLLDWRTQSFAAAVQFDYNTEHVVEDSVFIRNVDAGIALVGNNPHHRYFRSKIKYCKFDANGGDAVVTNAPSVQIVGCDFINHQNGAGVRLWPAMQFEKQRELFLYLKSVPDFVKLDLLHDYANPDSSHAAYDMQRIIGETQDLLFVSLSDADQDALHFNNRYSGGSSNSNPSSRDREEIWAPGWESKSSTTQFSPSAARSVRLPSTSKVIVRLATDIRNVIGLHILSTPFSGSTESLRIYDGDEMRPEKEEIARNMRVWHVSANVSHLPAISSGYEIVMEYTPGTNPKGGLFIWAKALPRTDYAPPPQLSLEAVNSTMSHNKAGVLVTTFDLADANEDDLWNHMVWRFHNSSIAVRSSRIWGLHGATTAAVQVENIRRLNPAFPSGTRRSDQRSLFLDVSPEITALSHTTIELVDSIFELNRGGTLTMKTHQDQQLSRCMSGNIYNFIVNNCDIRDNNEARHVIRLDLPVSLGKRTFQMWRELEELLRYGRYDQRGQGWDTRTAQANGGVSMWTARDWANFRRLGFETPSTENLPTQSVHTIVMMGNRFVRNQALTVVDLTGDFARVNFSRNSFERNTCMWLEKKETTNALPIRHQGFIMRVRGTEKELAIRLNQIKYNTCSRIVTLDMDSHSSSTGFVPAQFEFNEIQFNEPLLIAEVQAGNKLDGDRFDDEEKFHAISSNKVPVGFLHRQEKTSVSYAILVGGSQFVNITNNLLENVNFQYELVSALPTNSIFHQLIATDNWWGTTDSQQIQNRVFDFHDWNCFAPAKLSPALERPRYDAEPRLNLVSLPLLHTSQLNTSDSRVLGGMLTQNLVLSRRRPFYYVVERDLTIMPGATLTIEFGVEIKFYPNVGILVLGQLHAKGLPEAHIVFDELKSGERVDEEFVQTSHRADVNRCLLCDQNTETEKDVDLTNYLALGGIRLTQPPLHGTGANPTLPTLPRNYMNNTDVDVIPKSNEGFVEIFNRTTSQWVPLWQLDFSINTARVICRQLGYDSDGQQPYVWRTTHYLDVRFVRHWIQPFYCAGNEQSIDQCQFPGVRVDEPPVEQLLREFLYVNCPTMNENKGAANGWGGVRFGRAQREALWLPGDETKEESVMHYVDIFGAGRLHGKKASGVVQIVFRNPSLQNVKIYRSIAHNGLLWLGANAHTKLDDIRVENVQGTGATLLTLNPGGPEPAKQKQSSLAVGANLQEDDSDTSTDSGTAAAYTKPVQGNSLALDAHMFGLVDICSPEKVVYVNKRILVLFRYNSGSSSGSVTQRRNCVKIFRAWSDVEPPDMPPNLSRRDRWYYDVVQDPWRDRIDRPYYNPYDHRNAKLGFRLLDVRLLSSSNNNNSPSEADAIELYDGNVYNISQYKMLTRITTQAEIGRLYETTTDMLTIHLQAASAAAVPVPEEYGFIAEIIRLPVAYIADVKLPYFNLTNCKFSRNDRGALKMYTFGGGALNPSVNINRCQFRHNGRILGPLLRADSYGSLAASNFSTSNAAVSLKLHNTNQLRFFNNIIKQNVGGLFVNAASTSSASSLQAEIENCLFEENWLFPALHMITGQQVRSSNYQEVQVINNAFYRHWSVYDDAIALEKLVANFSHNQVVENAGRYVLRLDGFEQASLSEYQIVERNSFLYNKAYGRPELTLWRAAPDAAIIYAAHGGQRITRNIFMNPDADFDLATGNRTLPLAWEMSVNATNNFWGLGTEWYVAARVQHIDDLASLVAVDYTPWEVTNITLLSGGECAPGWTQVLDSCYLYIGGPVTYREAYEFCLSTNSSLPYADKIEHELSKFVAREQRDYSFLWSTVWVQSYLQETASRACTYMREQQLWFVDTCDVQDELAKPFICERDPLYAVNVRSLWWREPFLIVAVVLCVFGVILIVLLCALQCKKAKIRRREARERRAAIRNSMRSTLQRDSTLRTLPSQQPCILSTSASASHFTTLALSASSAALNVPTASGFATAYESTSESPAQPGTATVSSPSNTSAVGMNQNVTEDYGYDSDFVNRTISRVRAVPRTFANRIDVARLSSALTESQTSLPLSTVNTKKPVFITGDEDADDFTDSIKQTSTAISNSDYMSSSQLDMFLATTTQPSQETRTIPFRSININQQQAQLKQQQQPPPVPPRNPAFLLETSFDSPVPLSQIDSDKNYGATKNIYEPKITNVVKAKTLPPLYNQHGHRASFGSGEFSEDAEHLAPSVASFSCYAPPFRDLRETQPAVLVDRQSFGSNSTITAPNPSALHSLWSVNTLRSTKTEPDNFASAARPVSSARNRLWSTRRVAAGGTATNDDTDSTTQRALLGRFNANHPPTSTISLVAEQLTRPQVTARNLSLDMYLGEIQGRSVETANSTVDQDILQTDF